MIIYINKVLIVNRKFDGKEPIDGKLSRWVRELKRTSERAASYLSSSQ